jgi:PAS domain S-box-containing protein
MQDTGSDRTEHQRSEEYLLESERRFHSVIQTATDAIVLADRSGNIIAWNRAAQIIFSYREEEVLGQPLTMVMPERYRDAHRKGIARLQSGGEARVIGTTVELHGLRKDGSEFPLELSIGTWQTAEGIFYSGIIRDITERKRAEEERERLILELQDAMTKIKVLGGLLPICATCKKIRDDKGYWKQLEDYITDHSEAQFTHGICTDCARKLHPDWDDAS